MIWDTPEAYAQLETGLTKEAKKGKQEDRLHLAWAMDGVVGSELVLPRSQMSARHRAALCIIVSTKVTNPWRRMYVCKRLCLLS